MVKIRTLNDLQDFLDKESSWRRRELDALKRQVGKLKGQAQTSLLRANVAILYAHWEGFIKSCSVAYIEYVSRQGLSTSKLATCFAFLALRKQLNELAKTKSAKLGVSTLKFLRKSQDENHSLSFDRSIDTESNLSSSVFENILLSIGLQTTKYMVYEKLIDTELLSRRNKVAHGEFIDIDEAAYASLFADVTKLMEWFKTDIENAASMRSFEEVD